MKTNSKLFKDNELNGEKLSVVKQYFNSINHQYFLTLAEDHLNIIGRGNEHTGCEFAEELDKWEEQFEGVRCWFEKKEITEILQWLQTKGELREVESLSSKFCTIYLFSSYFEIDSGIDFNCTFFLKNRKFIVIGEHTTFRFLKKYD